MAVATEMAVGLAAAAVIAEVADAVAAVIAQAEVAVAYTLGQGQDTCMHGQGQAGTAGAPSRDDLVKSGSVADWVLTADDDDAGEAEVLVHSTCMD